MTGGGGINRAASPAASLSPRHWLRYVPPNRIDFLLQKIQNRSRILEFFPEQALIFKSFTPEQDPFLTVWCQMLEMPVTFLKNDRPNPSFLLKKCACLLAKDTECVPVSLSYDTYCAFQN